jgi:hypothetical protein
VTAAPTITDAIEDTEVSEVAALAPVAVGVVCAAKLWPACINSALKLVDIAVVIAI